VSEGEERVGRGATGAGGAVDAPLDPLVDAALYDRYRSLQWAEEMKVLAAALFECRNFLVRKIASDGPGAVHPQSMPLNAMLTLSAMGLASYDSQEDAFGEAVLGIGRPGSEATSVLSFARLAMIGTAAALFRKTGERDFLATMNPIVKSLEATFLLYEGLVISTGVRLWEGLPAVQRTPLPPQWRFNSLVELARNGGVWRQWTDTEAAIQFTIENVGRVRAALAGGHDGTLALPRLPEVPRRH
jgi:hypothetical protein